MRGLPNQGSTIPLCRATSQYVKSVFPSKMIFHKLSENFQFLKFAYRPNYKPRDDSIKVKLYRNFEEGHLRKFRIRRVPCIALFQQNLEKYGILYENNGF